MATKKSVKKVGLAQKVAFVKQQLKAGKEKAKVIVALITKFAVNPNYARTIVYYYAK